MESGHKMREFENSWTSEKVVHRTHLSLDPPTKS